MLLRDWLQSRALNDLRVEYAFCFKLFEENLEGFNADLSVVIDCQSCG